MGDADDDDLARHHADYHAHLYHLSRAGGSIAGWTVERVLGRGGFGAVAKVHHPDGGTGALKLAHPTVCEKETDILRSFGGNTIPILIADPVALSEVDFPAACYVMELADLTLAQYFAGDGAHPVPDVTWCSLAKDEDYHRVYGRVPYERREQDALAVAGAVLVALGRAKPHRHLDLCPSNVLLFGSEPTTWTPKVADWGNERVYEDGGETSYTLIGGKELWCPPRTRAHSLNRGGATPEPPTDKTDIYGLGALVCWILTGTVPDQLARWDAHDDPNSGAGLPLDRLGESWHEFLVATTRADRRKRINRDEAMDLLVTNRSIARRHGVRTGSRPLAMTTDLLPAHPPMAPRPEPPERRPEPTRSPTRRLRRLAALATTMVLTTAVNLEHQFPKNTVPGIPISSPSPATSTDPPTSTEPPENALPALFCESDHWCAEVRDDLTQFAVQGLEATVRDWYAGTVTRSESTGSGFSDRSYSTAVVVRLNLSNSTGGDHNVARDEIGLFVALADGATVPEGASITEDQRLAWVPALPDTTDDGRDLMPPTTVTPQEVVNDRFPLPYTAVFDVSSIGGDSRIIGLGSAQVSATGEVSLVNLQPAGEWPLHSDSVDELYEDLGGSPGDEQDSLGRCFLEMFEVGESYWIVDCARPHHGEVIGRTTGSTQDEAAEACVDEYQDDTGIDVGFEIWAIADNVQAGGSHYCIALAEGNGGLSSWVEPQSDAAIIATG